MAGFNPSQPRQAGGKFGTTGAQKAGAASVAAPTGITITPQMYKSALAQAAKIIAAQRAQAATLKSMTPQERQAYHTGQAAKRLAVRKAGAAKRAEAKRKRDARVAANRKAAAAARRPGAVAAGTAMAHSGRARPSPASAPRAGAQSGASASSSAVQARLREYMAGRLWWPTT